jgi:hypothetical protein
MKVGIRKNKYHQNWPHVKASNYGKVVIIKNMESGPKRSHKEDKGSHIHDAGVKESCYYSGFIYSNIKHCLF